MRSTQEINQPSPGGLRAGGRSRAPTGTRMLALLGAGLLTLALSACSLPLATRLESATPSATPTSLPPTPTLSPTPTATASATSTVTATPTITPTPIILRPPEGEPFVIGYSVEGRPLWVTRFGSGPVVRLIVGGIHGGYEWNTVDLVEGLIQDFHQGTLLVPPDVTLYILRNLNPDGYENYWGQYAGRSNANGVDLNRNWDANWQPTWPLEGCFSAVTLTGGTAPFSEPETQALAQFLLDYEVDALVSYHSQMSAIYATGDETLDPAADDLARGLAAASGYQYPPPWSSCVYTGQLVDWAVDQGIAAVTVELTTHDDPDLALNRRLVNAFLAWRRPAP